MIDIGFVNGKNMYCTYEYFESVKDKINDIGNEIQRDFALIGAIEEKCKLDYEIMSPYYENGKISYEQSKSRYMLEAEKEGVFAKIGKGVMAIFKAIKNAIASFIDWMKSFSFRAKSSEEKAKEMIKRHPDISREQIDLAMSKGLLDFNAMKYLKDIDTQYDAVVRSLGANSTADKVLNSFTSGVKKASVAVGAVAAGAKTVVTLKDLMKYHKQSIAENEAVQAELQRKINAQYKDLVAKSKAQGEDVNNKNLSDQQLLIALAQARLGYYTDALQTCRTKSVALNKELERMLKSMGASGTEIKDIKKASNTETTKHANLKVAYNSDDSTPEAKERSEIAREKRAKENKTEAECIGILRKNIANFKDGDALTPSQLRNLVDLVREDKIIDAKVKYIEYINASKESTTNGPSNTQSAQGSKPTNSGKKK